MNFSMVGPLPNLADTIVPRLRTALDPAEIISRPGVKAITFVSPINYAMLRDENGVLSDFDDIAVDSISLAKLYALLLRRPIARQSFDLSSLGREVLQLAHERQLSLVPIGATDAELQRFLDGLARAYPAIRVPAAFSGYFTDGGRAVIAGLSEILPDLIVIGMGSPRQEKLAAAIKQQVPGRFTIFTCGAFISQFAVRARYYPWLIDKLHLRWAYRLVREPHTRSRFIRLFAPGLFFAARDVLAASRSARQPATRA